MFIKKISLQNFKCFKDFEVSFKSNFNVIIGINGTGKSSILKAIQIATSNYFVGIKSPYAKPNSFQETDILQLVIEQKRAPQFPVKVDGIYKFHGTPQDEHSSARWREDESGSVKYGNKNPLVERAKQDYADAYDQDKSADTILPLITFYGTQRVASSPSITEGKIMQRDTRMIGYVDSASAGVSNEHFLNWYLTESLNIKENSDYRGSIDLVKDTLLSFLDGWTNLYVQFTEIYLRDKYGNPASFDLLSDGYKGLIGMVADLAFRCISLNDHLDDPIKETPGIVLVDELDLHLHPSLQRTVVTRLKNAFPKLQFIVTSHSPFIVQSVKPEELILLEQSDDGERMVSYGSKDYHRWRVDQILASELFGVQNMRSEEVERLETRKAEILSIPETNWEDGWMRELQLIEQQLGQLPLGNSQQDMDLYATVKAAAEKILNDEKA